MARKKIRECVSKQLLKKHHKGLPASFTPVQANEATNWTTLREENPWIATAKLVVKPDMLFGQRGKHDLVALNVDIDGAEKFVKDRLGRVITVGEKTPVTDKVTTFIIERFVPHKEEYYLSINSLREATTFYISAKGGVEVEENWDSIKSFDVEVGETVDNSKKESMLEGFNPEHKDAFWEFLIESFRVFEDLDFTMMEFNPICVIEDAESKKAAVIPLDMRGELDDQAAFKNQKKWFGLADTFPNPFGHQPNDEEDYVALMDSQTGASLKLTILNPKGRVWLLVAGGGASVIYTDTVCDLGFGETLGNYGEYSGNPTDDHTYEYAKTVLAAATKSEKDGGGPPGRALVIGGGIANFTDVKATFRGICRALLECSEQIKASEMKIYVRRGGPNYEAALKMMKDIEAGVGVPVEVFGPETHMTKIVHMAADYIKEFDEGKVDGQ